MNSIFRAYPTHPWITDWTFEPSGCNTAYRESCSDHFFSTRPTVGQVVPHGPQPDWALQIPVPQNSHINLLANGFCAYFEQRKIKCSAEIICPEPGVLWGRYSGIPDPALISRNPGEEINGDRWVESDTLNVLLAVRDGRFCLVSKARVAADAVKTAGQYLEKDVEQIIQGELDRRSGAASFFEEMTHHDSLAAICVETMFKSLRPAEGRIPHIWSQSPTTDAPRFDLNELYPLATAWCLINPATAEELVLCALKIQTNSGALPVHFAPHTTYSVLEAPKPLLAKTVEKVWEARRNPDFLKTAVPLLRRHLQWMLHHFDPKRRNIYSWKSQNEPLVPEQYQTDLATVDLAVLILTEIEAINRLRLQTATLSTHPPYFEEERATLQQSIVEMFWNANDHAFSIAFLRDIPTPLRGYSELLPLLWEGLPQMQKSAVIEHIRSSENLPGQHSVLSWRQSSLDDNAFPMLQQFLLLQALSIADPHGSVMSDFSRVTIQGFVEWHTLSLESSNTLRINAATASYILNVQAIHKYRYHAKGAVSGFFFKIMRKAKVDRTDLLVLSAVVIVIFCVHTLYSLYNRPAPLQTFESRMNVAYAEQDARTSLENCLAIMKYYPEQASRARLLAANILMLSGDIDPAAELFARVRQDYPDSPAAMVSLGLAEQLQGNFKAAETNYYEFCYLFDEIFPNVVNEVEDLRSLMREGFRVPPKWQNIYRYQFMHELE